MFDIQIFAVRNRKINGKLSFVCLDFHKLIGKLFELIWNANLVHQLKKFHFDIKKKSSHTQKIKISAINYGPTSTGTSSYFKSIIYHRPSHSQLNEFLQRNAINYRPSESQNKFSWQDLLNLIKNTSQERNF